MRRGYSNPNAGPLPHQRKRRKQKAKKPLLGSPMDGFYRYVWPEVRDGNGPTATTITQTPDPANVAAAKVRERIRQLERMHANYLTYQADRVAEGDHHAVWDAAIDIQTTEFQLKELRFALEAFGYAT